MSRSIEFKYVFSNGAKTIVEVYSLDQIEGIAEDDTKYHAEKGYKLIDKLQFTGLLDCNGAKIFEGDILLITEIDEDSSSGAEFTKEPVAVVWRNIQWMFDNGKYKVLGQKDWTDYATLSSYCRHNVDFKVIGNIHQNSELLK